jgi:hypothetical protein
MDSPPQSKRRRVAPIYAAWRLTWFWSPWGNPLQEQWIGRCGDQIGASVYIGVGALFDFVAGAVERAPLWIRQIWG